MSRESVALLRANQLPGGAELSDAAHERGGFAESIGGGVGFGLSVSVLTRPDHAAGGELSGVGAFFPFFSRSSACDRGPGGGYASSSRRGSLCGGAQEP